MPWNATIPTEMRDLAQRLLTYEANLGDASEQVGSVTLRAYEKLRRCLGELAGPAGFLSLASRALAAARSETPYLSGVQLIANGDLTGMIAIESSINFDKDGDYEAGASFISHLLGLLLIFLGQALTINLLRDVWQDADLGRHRSENGRKT